MPKQDSSLFPNPSIPPSSLDPKESSFVSSAYLIATVMCFFSSLGCTDSLSPFHFNWQVLENVLTAPYTYSSSYQIQAASFFKQCLQVIYRPVVLNSSNRIGPMFGRLELDAMKPFQPTPKKLHLCSRELEATLIFSCVCSLDSIIVTHHTTLYTNTDDCFTL